MEQMSSTLDTHKSIYECCILYGLGNLWECHDECMGDLNVHLAIWRIFMYTNYSATINFYS